MLVDLIETVEELTLLVARVTQGDEDYAEQMQIISNVQARLERIKEQLLKAALKR